MSLPRSLVKSVAAMPALSSSSCTASVIFCAAWGMACSRTRFSMRARSCGSKTFLPAAASARSRAASTGRLVRCASSCAAAARPFAHLGAGLGLELALDAVLAVRGATLGAHVGAHLGDRALTPEQLLGGALAHLEGGDAGGGELILAGLLVGEQSGQPLVGGGKQLVGLRGLALARDRVRELHCQLILGRLDGGAVAVDAGLVLGRLLRRGDFGGVGLFLVRNAGDGEPGEDVDGDEESGVRPRRTAARACAPRSGMAKSSARLAPRACSWGENARPAAP